MMRSTIAKRVLRGAAIVGIACATWEMCARIQDQVTLGIPATHLHFTAPALYAYGRSGPHGLPFARDGKFQMNSRGFRGPEPVQGRPTILCLGASETFGVYESPGQEYPRQLERRLNARRTAARVQVVNAALPGERMDDIVRILPQTLRAMHPVYAVVYPSTGSAVWTDVAWNAMHPTPKSKDPPEERTGRLHIVSRIRTAVLNALPESYRARMRSAEVEAAIAAAHVTPTDHLPDENFRLFRLDFDRALDYLTRAHVPTIVVTHATRFGSLGTKRDSQIDVFRTMYPKLTGNGLFDAERRFNAQVRAAAHKHRFPVVEAATAIAPGAQNFADFYHFTDGGSARMAELIAKALPES